MLHQKIVVDAIESYKQTLDDAIATAQTLTLESIFALRFNTSMISPEWITTELKDLRTGYAKADKRKCVIYVFTLAEKVAGDKQIADKERQAADLQTQLTALTGRARGLEMSLAQALAKADAQQDIVAELRAFLDSREPPAPATAG